VSYELAGDASILTTTRVTLMLPTLLETVGDSLILSIVHETATALHGPARSCRNGYHRGLARAY
jgi:hypothetical protein